MKDGENRRTFLGAFLAGGALASSPAAGAKSKAATQPQGVFNVQDFGAAATGQVLDTKALQSAIDAAGQSGGLVYFPPGTYLSGTLTLKSHVSLRLEGKQTENISIAANDLRASKQPLNLGPGVRPESVLANPPMQPYRCE